MTPTVIDLSHHDPSPDFVRLKAAGIELVFFKATEGLKIVDQTYDKRCRMAREAGLMTGAYHFGVNADGSDQAKHFLDVAVKGDILGFDLERSAHSIGIGQSEEFIEKILDAQGRLPLLYYGEYLLEQANLGHINRKSIIRKCLGWGSRYYTKRPKTIIDQRLALWQYTGDGVGPTPHKIDGVGGNVDLNVWVDDFSLATIMSSVAIA